MTCPICNSEQEMALSALIHGFMCAEPDCGTELEMEEHDAEEILAAEDQVTILA